MVDVESDMSILLDDKNFRIKVKKRPRPESIQAFFVGLKTHEATMLFAVSGDPSSLKKFADDAKDRFFSKNFRDACNGVLFNVHGIKNSRTLPPKQLNKI